MGPAVTKICLALTQLGLAIDCFVTANKRLEGSNVMEPALVCVCLGLYILTSFAETIVIAATVSDTNCLSCCLAHGRVRVYLAWSVPSLLLMALIAIALMLLIVFGLYFILKSFVGSLVPERPARIGFAEHFRRKKLERRRLSYHKKKMTRS